MNSSHSWTTILATIAIDSYICGGSDEHTPAVSVGILTLRRLGAFDYTERGSCSRQITCFLVITAILQNGRRLAFIAGVDTCVDNYFAI